MGRLQGEANMTYLLGEDVSSEISQGQFEAPIASFDGNLASRLATNTCMRAVLRTLTVISVSAPTAAGAAEAMMSSSGSPVR